MKYKYYIVAQNSNQSGYTLSTYEYIFDEKITRSSHILKIAQDLKDTYNLEQIPIITNFILLEEFKN